MEKSITITYGDLRTKVLRNLQVMGKRYVDGDGKNQFTKVTVGTVEYPLLDDFIRKAIHDVTAKIADLVHSYTETDSKVSFSVNNSRWEYSDDDHVAVAFENAVSDYVVTMAVGEYYSMYFNEQSQWNVSRAQGLMQDILSLCYIKQAPKFSSVEEETTGTYSYES